MNSTELQETTQQATREAQQAAPSSKKDSFLRSRPLWSGEVLAGVGENAAGVAYPLRVLAMTGSAAWAGAVGSVQSVTGKHWSALEGVACGGHCRSNRGGNA